MVDATDQLPLGSQFLSMGLRQGTYFSAAVLPRELLLDWANYRSDPSLRPRPIKSEALLVVVSQDCDIACKNPSEDPCIELAIFYPIQEKKMHAGSQFANSVRKLQLQLDNNFYEAKVRETVRVPKQALIENIDRSHISALPPQLTRTVVLWRANRYLREAFPDRFVRVFQPILTSYLPSLMEQSKVPDSEGYSYIRALYVHLSNHNETGDCGFALTLLLRADTTNEAQSNLDDLMTELCTEIENADDNFNLLEDMHFAGLAESERTVTVATLGQYVKYNLDSASLSTEDPDVGDTY